MFCLMAEMVGGEIGMSVGSGREGEVGRDRPKQQPSRGRPLQCLGKFVCLSQFKALPPKCLEWGR